MNDYFKFLKIFNANVLASVFHISMQSSKEIEYLLTASIGCYLDDLVHLLVLL